MVENANIAMLLVYWLVVITMTIFMILLAILVWVQTVNLISGLNTRDRFAKNKDER